MMSARILTMVGGDYDLVTLRTPAFDKRGKLGIKLKTGIVHFITVMPIAMPHRVQSAAMQDAIINAKAIHKHAKAGK